MDSTYNGLTRFMKCTVNGTPIFVGQIGLSYETWSNRVKVFLREWGYDVWKSIVIGYIGSKKPKTVAKKELKINNKITMDFILKR